jgi:hypothetical protein
MHEASDGPMTTGNDTPPAGGLWLYGFSSTPETLRQSDERAMAKAACSIAASGALVKVRRWGSCARICQACTQSGPMSRPASWLRVGFPIPNSAEACRSSSLGTGSLAGYPVLASCPPTI